jgi:hypothetical protein
MASFNPKSLTIHVNSVSPPLFRPVARHLIVAKVAGTLALLLLKRVKDQLNTA